MQPDYQRILTINSGSSGASFLMTVDLQMGGSNFLFLDGHATQIAAESIKWNNGSSDPDQPGQNFPWIAAWYPVLDDVEWYDDSLSHRI